LTQLNELSAELTAATNEDGGHIVPAGGAPDPFLEKLKADNDEISEDIVKLSETPICSPFFHYDRQAVTLPALPKCFVDRADFDKFLAPLPAIKTQLDDEHSRVVEMERQAVFAEKDSEFNFSTIRAGIRADQERLKELERAAGRLPQCPPAGAAASPLPRETTPVKETSPPPPFDLIPKTPVVPVEPKKEATKKLERKHTKTATTEKRDGKYPRTSDGSGTEHPQQPGGVMSPGLSTAIGIGIEMGIGRAMRRDRMDGDFTPRGPMNMNR
jgi:hypothetical protein